MNWQRLLITGTLSAGLIAAGCGDDPAVIDDQDQQDEVDEFAESADVWVGGETTGEDSAPTTVDIGDSFGARFDADEEEPFHRFGVTAQAGEVLTISLVEIEEELEDRRDEMAVQFVEETGDDAFFAPLPRQFTLEHHDQREFFVSETANYDIDVVAPGGEDAGFVLETSTRSVEADEAFELPGTTEGDLSDGSVDIYEVSEEQLQSVTMEVFARRAPFGNDLDAWMYIWDVENGELVAQNDAQDTQDEDLWDPLVSFDMQPDTTYWVVMDMVVNSAEGEYHIESEYLDTSSTNRMELDPTGTDQFEGQVEERHGAPFYDYFTVTVEPGEFVKIEVEGDDELQPVLELDEQQEEEDPFAQAAAEAFPVGETAAATLGVGDDHGGAVTFTVDVTDFRNLTTDPDEMDAYYGGDGFGYTVSVESLSPQAQSLSGGDSQVIELDAPGDLELLDVHVDDGHLLWLDSGTRASDEEVDDIADFEFAPALGLADKTTLEAVQPYQGFQWGSGDEFSFLLRDYFFRGEDDGYDTEVQIQVYDATTPDYQPADLKDDNESLEEAAELSLPARIDGEFEAPEGQQGMQQDPDQQETDPEIYYFEFDAEPGDHIVAHTEHGPNNLTWLSISDDDGETLNESGIYIEQRQDEDEDAEEFYYDGAVVHEVDEAGTFVLGVEQYCEMSFLGEFCTYGDVGVEVFIASDGE